MDRSVAAVGATSGSLSALLLRFLSEFNTPTAPPSCPAFDLGDCPICPDIDLAALRHLRLGDLDLLSVVVGLLIGVLLGPVLDLLQLLRNSWRVWLQSKLQKLAKEGGEPLYKLA